MTITEIILKKRQEYIISYSLKSFVDINSGLCEQFAMDVIREMGGYRKGLHELCTENFPEKRYWGHVWVFYNGKHYDSEHSNGVENIDELFILNQPRT
jgi:hypothetical protein